MIEGFRNQKYIAGRPNWNHNSFFESIFISFGFLCLLKMRTMGGWGGGGDLFVSNSG